MTSLDELRISFIDCQSTGPNPATSELLELAYDEDVYLLTTSKPISKKIQSLTGIQPEELMRAITPEQVFHILNTAFEKNRPAWIVAHFARFELGMLNRLWQEYAGTPFPVPFICTHQLAKRLHSDLPTFGLRSVAGWYGDTLHEHKRAQDHVHATKVIWKKMIVELADRGVNDSETLAMFLNEKPQKPATTKKTYLIERDLRLTLPEEPGIYRYVARNGRILYVGKATSLKHRVNSYFTGGLKRDHRKREMLSQAVDVKITVVPTPLHAGMLEYSEIQTHQPPYNKMLRGRIISMESELQLLVKDPQLLDEADLEHASTHVFYGIDDLTVLRAGLTEWRRLYPEETVWTYRRLVQFGLPLLKEWIVAELKRRKEKAEADALAAVEEDGDVAIDSEEESTEKELEEDVEFVWTPELIGESAVAWTRRAARDYVRTRYLRRLRGSVIVQSDAGFTYETSDTVDERQAKILLHEMRRSAAKGQPWEFIKPWPMHIPFWV